jgi:hypothetical protein
MFPLFRIDLFGEWARRSTIFWFHSFDYIVLIIFMSTFWDDFGFFFISFSMWNRSSWWCVHIHATDPSMAIAMKRVVRILFVLCLFPVLQQHAAGSCASESQALAENCCKSRLKAIHSMPPGAGRGKPQGRKQLPLSLGFKCAYCGGEFGSRAGMDCHRRHK